MNPITRIRRQSRRAMAPGIDHLESRQLLSTAAMPVHGPMPAHHHHAMRLHHAAAVGRLQSGHHGVAVPAATVKASTSSNNFQVVAQFNNASFTATAAIADNDIWAVGTSNDNASTEQPLAVHFDGTSWSVVSTPTLSGRAYSKAWPPWPAMMSGPSGRQDISSTGIGSTIDRALERHELERRLQPESEAGGLAECGHGHLDEQRLGRGVLRQLLGGPGRALGRHELERRLQPRLQWHQRRPLRHLGRCQ